MPCSGLDEACYLLQQQWYKRRGKKRHLVLSLWERQGMLPTEAELLGTLCKFEIKVLNKRHVYKDQHSLCQTASLV